MYKHNFLSSILALLTFTVVACGGTSEPQRGSTASQSGANGGETLAPTAAASTPEPSPAELATTETADSTSSGESSASPSTSKVVAPYGESDGGDEAVDIDAIMAQVMSSPELLGCLTSAMDISTLMEFTARTPTGEEMALLQPCLDGGLASKAPEDVLPEPTKPGFDFSSFFSGGNSSSQWQERIDAAFAPTSCPPVTPQEFPASYYQGPLIDSHLHIPPLPDDPFGQEDDGGNYGSGGVDQEQYDSIAAEDRPFLGRSVTVGQIVCTLEHEGSVNSFAFFPAYLDIQEHLIEAARRTVEGNPSLFVPFIQSSGDRASIVEPEILQDFLDIRPDLFFGLGEVGDSPTEPINPPPDSVLYTENFEVVEANGMSVVYYHTGEGHEENMARTLERFPGLTFIVHGDFVRPHIDNLMDRYPNIYFTFNDIFDEVIPMFRFGAKEDFVSAMRSEWDSMLEQALELYTPMIEDHPDRYMWGTDRADIAWNYDRDIGQLLAEYGRAFIGNFDQEVQEKIAYRNAETLIANNQPK